MFFVMLLCYACELVIRYLFLAHDGWLFCLVLLFQLGFAHHIEQHSVNKRYINFGIEILLEKAEHRYIYMICELN